MSLPSGQTPSRHDRLGNCYALHADKLLRLLVHISRSMTVAEDLAQDIWLRVGEIQRGGSSKAQDVTEFENPAAQWSYLSRMALNRYRDWLRRQRTVSIEELAGRMSAQPGEPQSNADTLDVLQGIRGDYERYDRLRAQMDAVMEAFVNDSSPPHQTIVFGFNRPMQWEPNKIVQHQSHKTLRILGGELCNDLAEVFPTTEARTTDLCRGLKERLSRGVIWEHVRASRAGTTELDIYFKKKDLIGRAKEATQWSLSVQRRIVKQLVAVERAAARSKE